MNPQLDLRPSAQKIRSVQVSSLWKQASGATTTAASKVGFKNSSWNSRWFASLANKGVAPKAGHTHQHIFVFFEGDIEIETLKCRKLMWIVRNHILELHQVINRQIEIA